VYKLVFDLGCNVMDFAEVCLQKHKGCKVVCVDAINFMNYPTTGVPDKFLRLNEEYEGEVLFMHALVNDTNDQIEDFYINATLPTTSTASDKWMNDSRFALGNDYILEQHRQQSQIVYSNGDNTSAAQISLDHWKEIIINKYGSIKSYMKKITNSDFRKVETKTINLEKMIELFGKPDLIKIDIEGYEKKAIMGLNEKVEKICFEWTEEMLSDLIDSFSQLKDLGYTQFSVLGFFEEKEKLEHLIYDEAGDEFLKEPESYHSYEVVVQELKKTCVPNRRVNWGMAWVK